MRLGLWLLPLAAMGIAGCSHTPPDELYAGARFAPQPPAFLSGSMALLLTNQAGFSARVTADTGSLAAEGANKSGQLLGQGARLVFAPDEDKSQPKRSRIGGISFIWDVAENHGYVLSDALQGYAPVSLSLHFTNLVTRVEREERADGHLCEVQQVMVFAADSSFSALQAWRAKDLNGFPVRISSLSNASPPTVSFSKVQLGPQPAELFQPPNGFTKYPSVEAMMTELALRQHNLRRRPGEDWDRSLVNPPDERRPY